MPATWAQCAHHITGSLLVTMALSSEQNSAYRLVQRHSNEHVEIEFSGTLSGQTVIWHASIRTLHDYYLSLARSTQTTGTIQAKQFIDIEEHATTPRLCVGLNLPVIDDAAILRTIIMIRQYKRLRPGRHEYGEPAIFQIATR